MAQRVAAQYGERAATSAAEAWEADDFDAVLIAYTTDTHVGYLLPGAARRQADLLEKPIDQEIDRARAVTAEAERSGVPVLIGFRRRFLADDRNVGRSIMDGLIGANRDHCRGGARPHATPGRAWWAVRRPRIGAQPHTAGRSRAALDRLRGGAAVTSTTSAMRASPAGWTSSLRRWGRDVRWFP